VPVRPIPASDLASALRLAIALCIRNRGRLLVAARAWSVIASKDTYDLRRLRVELREIEPLSPSMPWASPNARKCSYTSLEGCRLPDRRDGIQTRKSGSLQLPLFVNCLSKHLVAERLGPSCGC